MAITIDGKQYDEKKLSPELQNYLAVRQEIQVSKTRHTIEIEKIVNWKGKSNPIDIEKSNDRIKLR